MKNQQENSSRFLDAFNRIEHGLRRIVQKDRGTSFVRLVDEAVDRGVHIAKSYRVDLKEFAELRNAIVHNRKNEIIAEPHLLACETLEKIASLLTDPPKLLNLFKRQVEVVGFDDSIGTALSKATQYGFSQLPVAKEDAIVGLLTSNTVMRWLGKCVEEEIFSLTELTVGEILKHTEYQDNLEFLGREAGLFDVIDLFESHDQKGRRLEAVLITNDGKADQGLLGIVTHWDLPAIHNELSVR